MDNLTAADLFSPSKARQQRAQAQDWAQIDNWLSYKYAGRSVPSFERNEETLKVLRELALANERADEERAVYERLEREALKESNEQPPPQELLATLHASLPPSASRSLAALAETASTLSLPTADPKSTAHNLISYTMTSQTVTNQLTHIHSLQSYLAKQHTMLREQLAELQKNPAFRTPESLPRQTSENMRQTKHLRAKIRDAEDRLSNLEYAAANGGHSRQRSISSSITHSHSRSNSLHTPTTSITPGSALATSADALSEMLEAQRELDTLRKAVEAVEREVDEFAGLPAERESARREVGRLEVELDGLRRTRDGLFGGLVGR